MQLAKYILCEDHSLADYCSEKIAFDKY